MLVRPRPVTLAWAGVCAGLFLVLAFLVHLQRAPLNGFDDLGRTAEQWARDQGWLVSPLRRIEAAFATIGMTVWTTLIAVPLFFRGYRRAAVFTVGVMISTSLATTGVKLLYGRSRPTWQDPVGKLISKSFPSGHASSSAALAGVLMVLAVMLVRKAFWRRAIYVGAVLLALVVGADRVLLGRHYPTDVIGGYLLGACVVLLWLSFFDPQPRSRADAADPLPEAVPSEHRLAVILNPAKIEDADQFRSVVLGEGGRGGVVGAHLALHDRRGPRHRHGRGGLDRRRQPGDGVRRRRHRPRGLRRARRDRHPGRDHPGRHRQPPRPQPRHPALPAGRGRRGPPRPGPRDRPGAGQLATRWRRPTSW